MNAQALRFMEILHLRTLEIKVKKIPVRLPHPVCFAFQKLIVSLRRTGRTAHKAENDRKTAFEILDELLQKDTERAVMRDIYKRLTKRQQQYIQEILMKYSRMDIFEILEKGRE